MRHGRSVLAGLVAGVVAGFLVALLRPRSTHPAASAHLDAPWKDEVAQTEPSLHGPTPDSSDVVPVGSTGSDYTPKALD